MTSEGFKASPGEGPHGPHVVAAKGHAANAGNGHAANIYIVAAKGHAANIYIYIYNNI